MKVVRFDNGKYGIRKATLFGYRYIYFPDKGVWLKPGHFLFKECQVELEHAREIFAGMGEGMKSSPINNE